MQDSGCDLSSLMRMALTGDAAAYRRVLDRIAVLVRAHVRGGLLRTGQSAIDVEDIVQETLLAIHLKRATWNPAQPLEPWVRAIARHKLADALRHRFGRPTSPLEEVEDTLVATSPAPDLFGSDAERLLECLDARQREIVTRIAVEGATAAEVAHKLGMSDGAVRVQLHRSLKVLAARWREIGE